MSTIVLVSGLLAAIIAGGGTFAEAATLTFTWVDNSTNEEGFQLKAKCAPAATFTDVGPVVEANITTLQIVQQDNLLCLYHLVAFNVAGVSAPSNEVSYSSFVVPNAPGSLQIQASVAISQAQRAVSGLKKETKRQDKAVATRQVEQAEQRLSGAFSLVVKAEQQLTE